MRTRFTSRLVALGLAGLSLAGVAVGTAGSAQAAGADPKVMGRNIEAQLAGKVMGFGYAIGQNGVIAASGQGGQARGPGDGNQSFTPNTRIEVASATKNIAAGAILQLLEKNQMSIDAKVNPYLPGNWPRGAGWEDVTFRMLLAHTSGLKQQGAALGNPAQWGTLFAGVQYAVSQPITADNGRQYSNMNYATLRILLPRLWSIAENNNGQPMLNSTNSGQIMLAYVNKYLFNPAGIAPKSCASNNTSALIYDGPNSLNPGGDPSLKGGDLEACAGHRGLNLSATDMVRWQTYLRNSAAFANVRPLMDNVANHTYGVNGWSTGAGQGSNTGLYFHGGDITVNGREVHTCQGKFGFGIQAAVIVNSPNDNIGGMCTVLANAYKASIV